METTSTNEGQKVNRKGYKKSAWKTLAIHTMGGNYFEFYFQISKLNKTTLRFIK